MYHSITFRNGNVYTNTENLDAGEQYVDFTYSVTGKLSTEAHYISSMQSIEHTVEQISKLGKETTIRISFLHPLTDGASVTITVDDARNTWEDWHLVPSSRPVINPPELKENTIEIPGADGVLDLSTSLTKYPLFQNRTGDIEFIVMNDYGGWANRYSDIMNYLQGRTIDAYLEDDYEWYYKGKFYISDWTSNNDGTWSNITISYIVEPYKLSTSKTNDEWLWDPFNFESGMITSDIFKDIVVNSDDYVRHSFSSFVGRKPVVPKFLVTVSGGSEYIGVDPWIPYSADDLDFSISNYSSTYRIRETDFYIFQENTIIPMGTTAPSDSITRTVVLYEGATVEDNKKVILPYETDLLSYETDIYNIWEKYKNPTRIDESTRKLFNDIGVEYFGFDDRSILTNNYDKNDKDFQESNRKKKYAVTNTPCYIKKKSDGSYLLLMPSGNEYAKAIFPSFVNISRIKQQLTGIYEDYEHYLYQDVLPLREQNLGLYFVRLSQLESSLKGNIESLLVNNYAWNGNRNKWINNYESGDSDFSGGTRIESTLIHTPFYLKTLTDRYVVYYDGSETGYPNKSKLLFSKEINVYKLQEDIINAYAKCSSVVREENFWNEINKATNERLDVPSNYIDCRFYCSDLMADGYIIEKKLKPGENKFYDLVMADITDSSIIWMEFKGHGRVSIEFERGGL